MGDPVTGPLVALGAVAGFLRVAAPAARTPAGFRLPGARGVVLGTLITQMVPGIVVSIALCGAYLGLVLADASCGIDEDIGAHAGDRGAHPGRPAPALPAHGAGPLISETRTT